MRQFIPVAAFFSLTAGICSRASADTTAIVGIAADAPSAQISVTLVGAPHLPASMLTLREGGDAHAQAVRATSVRTFAEGSEPIAIAIVYNGAEVWLGNETFEEDDNARYIGAIDGVKRSIDSIAKTRFPAGSTAALIAYSDNVDIRMPMQSIDHLHGSTVGTQLEYRNKIGTELVRGIDEGLRQLELSHRPHKALIVIGDGSDTDNEAAKFELADLKRRALRENIQTFAITYKGALSDPSSVITSMIPQARTVSSFDTMALALESSIDRLTDRTFVTFSGENLDWNGREHGLIVHAGDEDLDLEFVTLPGAPPVHHWYSSTWWKQLGAGFGAVLLLALGLRLRFRSLVP